MEIQPQIMTKSKWIYGGDMDLKLLIYYSPV